MNSPNPPQPPRRKAVQDAIRVLLVALFFVAAAFILRSPYVRQEVLDINTVRVNLQEGGIRKLGLFIIVSALVNAGGVPRIWICGVAGSLYGAAEGSLWGYVATLLGSSINFFMGRSLLRGPLKRHLPQRLEKWYKAFNNHGFSAVLYLRLFPLTNATLTNLLGGVSDLRYSSYILATAIGYLPFTIAFATLGSSAAKQNHWQLAAGLILFAAVALGQWLWLRMRKTGSGLHNDINPGTGYSSEPDKQP